MKNKQKFAKIMVNMTNQQNHFIEIEFLNSYIIQINLFKYLS